MLLTNEIYVYHLIYSTRPIIHNKRRKSGFLNNNNNLIAYTYGYFHIDFNRFTIFEA